jgi:proteasome lid subunit RPN8/RPN11
LLNLPRSLVDDIIAHARAEDPNECCGLIAGKEPEAPDEGADPADSKGKAAERGYRITNTAKSPYRYLMDPQEFLNADKDAESHGLSLVAFYHSHTHSAPYPSQTDVRMAVESGWLDPYYLLVSLEDKESPQVRLYTITGEGEILQAELRIV